MLVRMSAVVKQPEQEQERWTLTQDAGAEGEWRMGGPATTSLRLKIFMNPFCKPNTVNEYTPTEEMQ